MKPLLPPILILLLLFSPAYASWTEHTNVRYMDFDGDLQKEIIIEAKHGAGSNHYIEDLRIFKDTRSELKLIFSIRTLDRTFGFPNEMKQYNFDIVSDVEFTEQDPEKGTRDIIVKSKKIYYKDAENKVVYKEEDLRTKTYKWNGEKFVENKKLKEEFTPFPQNIDTVYEYDEPPDVCFFGEGAVWDGYEVTNKKWHQLTDYQKACFIAEAQDEIERQEGFIIKERVISPNATIAMNEFVRLMEEKMPEEELPMIKLLRDTLKNTEFIERHGKENGANYESD